MPTRSYSDTEAVLLLLKEKMRALTDANTALAAALVNTSNEAAIIETLDDCTMKCNLLEEKYKAIEAGAEVVYPTQHEVQSLTIKIKDLDSAIEHRGSIDTLLAHTSAIMAMWPFD
jgi:hypothetical protein